MTTDQMKSLAHGLRLFGVHGAFERRVQEARGQSLDYLEFLRLVLEDEVSFRKDRAAKVLLSRAKFRGVADLEDWDSTYERGITRSKLRELAGTVFIENAENLLILGRTGEGKTHLAVAIGRRLCASNVSTLFIPVNFLFEEVLAAKAQGKYLQYIKKLTATRAIILDDFGLRNYSHDEANVLMDLLEDRHKKGSVIVTSQVDPRGWGKPFEDQVISEAIVSRLPHPSQKLNLNGGNYREKLQTNLPPGKKLEQQKMLN